MRILSLDLSSSTGFAVFENDDKPVLVSYGSIALPQSVKSYGEHPWGLYNASVAMGKLCADKINEVRPDIIVIEEVNSARARFSQKFLDYVHKVVLDHIARLRVRVFYVDSSEWRRVTGSIMDKASKKANAKLAKAKRDAARNGEKLDKKKLGIRGKVNKKHVAINRANELFGLSLKPKDDDAADAILEAYSYILGARKTENE